MSTKTEKLKARLEQKESSLEKAYTALDDLLDTQFESYQFSDQTGRQEAINIDIEKLRKLITSLEKEIDIINQRLNGSFVSYIRLRR